MEITEELLIEFADMFEALDDRHDLSLNTYIEIEGVIAKEKAKLDVQQKEER